MNNLLPLIKDLLVQTIDNIDTGNTNITKQQAEELIDLLGSVNNPNEKLSKYQACKYLNISRATFDNYVREGKIPKGRRQQGFKEIFFYKKDLNKFLENKD